MGIFSKLFKKNTTDNKTGGIEDYMTLVRVYFQASIASTLGVFNLAMFPDMRTFKQTLHIPTQNNRLGLAEKNACKKMMKEIYNSEDGFFTEIDKSIKKNCRNIQDVQVYMLQFQNFSQDLMMLLGNLMKFKLRLPSFFKNALHTMTEKTVNDILTKNDFTDPEVMRTAVSIRKYNNRLGFTEQWIIDYVFRIVMLAKKETPKADDEK